MNPSTSTRSASVEVKRALIEKAGGLIGVAEAAAELHIQPQSVEKGREAGTILAFPEGGSYAYPRFQGEHSKRQELLPQVLTAMPIQSPWMGLEWLLEPKTKLCH